MRYKLPNSNFIGAYQGFVLNEIQYPRNWLELSTPQERQALGITEVQEQSRPNDQYYWVTDNNDGTFSTAPKDLEDGDEYVDLRGVKRRVQGLKSFHIEKVKQTAGFMLAATDWMVIRKAERDVAIPEAVAAKRAAIVAEADRLEAAINLCENVEQLIAVVGAQNWPN